MAKPRIPIYFHIGQNEHHPQVEWSGGRVLPHPEVPERADDIVKTLMAANDAFEMREPQAAEETLLARCHEPAYVAALAQSQNHLAEEGFAPSVYNYAAGLRSQGKSLNHAGGYCFDSMTPLLPKTFYAAALSAGCAYEAATAVKRGAPLAYALCRPPGHHAGKDLFGGYCYFNNAAVAALALRPGRVAILDIDFHHGNGTQTLFYEDPDVLVVNIHGDPARYFPYFTGFSSEIGSGRGAGFNLNLPLAEGTDGQAYKQVLVKEAIRALGAFGPKALILSAGFDTHKDDPLGGFALTTEDYVTIGGLLKALPMPKVVVQEGGYNVRLLGRNVEALLRGLS